ncbi:MAG: hypothetical protein QXY26_09115 [Ignisphaera sp.]
MSRLKALILTLVLLMFLAYGVYTVYLNISVQGVFSSPPAQYSYINSAIPRNVYITGSRLDVSGDYVKSATITVVVIRAGTYTLSITFSNGVDTVEHSITTYLNPGTYTLSFDIGLRYLPNPSLTAVIK